LTIPDGIGRVAMVRVVVVGGGWAGCAAACAARKAGAGVTLVERTDMLLGTGLVGGIMRNNGRLTAWLELEALGATDLLAIISAMTRHAKIDFPGHRHASLYDVDRIEPMVRAFLEESGVEILTQTRATGVKMRGRAIESIIVDREEQISGDVFVDATGTAATMRKCIRHDGVCVMCILRCPSFGPRVSIAAQAGVEEIEGEYMEAMSGSCKLTKDSLGTWLVQRLEKYGVVVVPIPKYVMAKDNLRRKACQQYALKEYADNLVLLDTGPAKLMAPFFPLEKLRQIPGFTSARYNDPYSGGKGNSIRYSIITPHDRALKVSGVENLFCAGEKTGLLVGHTEAIVTGTLAGHNAVRLAAGKHLLELPRSMAGGDIIAYINESVQTEEGRRRKYTFSGSVYFERMKELNLYTTQYREAERRARLAGLEDAFSQKIV
ncbi:MAG: FAD-dependent oxidoreductase, partial [Syntrophothermus sp.]